MSNQRFSTINDVVASRLCIGCGACQPTCPKDSIQLFDFESEGIRPVIAAVENCKDCDLCTKVCPSIETDFRLGVTVEGGFEREGIRNWGPILEIWEGHSSDQDIRYKGSSGGALTALSLYCLEKGGMHGILHTGQDDKDPSVNRTRLSTTAAAVREATGSRYSPASVCNGLKLIEEAPKPCAFIGKPSEIAALRKSQTVNPKLAENVGVAMTFFCAETPPTKATRSLIEKLGVEKGEQLTDLKYRGNGWPGHFAPTCKGDTQPRGKQTYQESWAFLQSFRPWSTHIWPDGGGELADISCGDPWYEQPDGKNPGSSLVVVRTAKGREIVNGAIAAGYIELKPAELWKLDKSQDNLLQKKGATWGRVFTMKLLGMKAPQFSNAHLFHCWLSLPLDGKLRSTIGTLKRILKRGLRNPLQLEKLKKEPLKPPVSI